MNISSVFSHNSLGNIKTENISSKYLICCFCGDNHFIGDKLHFYSKKLYFFVKLTFIFVQKVVLY